MSSIGIISLPPHTVLPPGDEPPYECNCGFKTESQETIAEHQRKAKAEAQTAEPIKKNPEAKTVAAPE